MEVDSGLGHGGVHEAGLGRGLVLGLGGRLGRRHFEMIKKSVEIYEDRCGGV